MSRTSRIAFAAVLVLGIALSGCAGRQPDAVDESGAPSGSSGESSSSTPAKPASNPFLGDADMATFKAEPAGEPRTITAGGDALTPRFKIDDDGKAWTYFDDAHGGGRGEGMLVLSLRKNRVKDGGEVTAGLGWGDFTGLSDGTAKWAPRPKDQLLHLAGCPDGAFPTPVAATNVMRGGDGLVASFEMDLPISLSQENCSSWVRASFPLRFVRQ